VVAAFAVVEVVDVDTKDWLGAALSNGKVSDV